MRNIGNYYIDFENVGVKGIEGFQYLQSSNNLNLIYSVNISKLTIKVVDEILESEIQIAFHYVRTKGTNALDFYLTAMVISDIESYGEGSYYIVSKDLDFRHLEAFVNERYAGSNVRLIRSDSIKDIIIQNIKNQQVCVAEDDYTFLAK